MRETVLGCSRTVLKSISLNVTHIKYITCMHSFKVALIAFLVTSWLNWSRHCMHVVYFALWYELIEATARRHLCACSWRARAPSTVPFPRSFRAWCWSEVECASETSPVWFDRKNVMLLNTCTSCQEKEWEKQQLWVRWPTLAPPLR